MINMNIGRCTTTLHTGQQTSHATATLPTRYFMTRETSLVRASASRRSFRAKRSTSFTIHFVAR